VVTLNINWFRFYFIFVLFFDFLEVSFVVTLNKLSDYSYQFDLRKKKLITMDFEDKFGMT